MVGRAWSSLLVRESFSRKVGEGARVAGAPLEGAAFSGSEKERFLVGVLVDVPDDVGSGGGRSIAASILLAFRG